MSKRVETNIQAIDPEVFRLCERIANDPKSSLYEHLLANMLRQTAATVNLLLAKLEFGDVIVSESPPDDRRQYSRRDKPKR